MDETIAALRGTNVDRVESMWEPRCSWPPASARGSARPGLDVDQTIPFRDKQVMKEVLDAAGIRVPRSVRAPPSTPSAPVPTRSATRSSSSRSPGPARPTPTASTNPLGSTPSCRGSAACPRSASRSSSTPRSTRSTPSRAGGRIEFYNICWYRPRPLAMKQLEWVSPQVFALREPDAAALAGGVAMGHAVLEVMGLDDGFTHMEWYRTADGEVVFGEIGARARRRPPRRRHELRQRRRRVPGLGRSGVPRPVQPGGRPQVQRRPDLSSGRRVRAGSSTSRACPACWPRSASTSSSSTCSRSERRGGTGPAR